MGEGTIHDRIERAAKALPVALAALYLTGFIVLSYRLAGYGGSSLDLFRIQYFAAGFWFGVFCALFFALALPGSLIAGHLSSQVLKNKFGFAPSLAATELIGTVVFDFLQVTLGVGLISIISKIAPRLNPDRPIPEVHPLLFFVNLAAIDFLFRAWSLSRLREKEGIARVFESYYCMFFLALLVPLSMMLFGRNVYPAIPFSAGGGQTRQVFFWLGQQSISTPVFLEREGNTGHTVPYELLLETENSYVVMSPNDNQRSIAFDRKDVEAMVVLGKRPRSAPANFFRNISEPPDNRYEVIERSEKQVPNFTSKGSHPEIDYVLLHDGHKFYAACDTTTLDKLDPTATCAFRVLRNYQCTQPTDAEPKKALSDLKCKDDEDHPVYLYVSKKD